MTNRENPTMNAVEPAPLEAGSPALTADARTLELFEGDHAVLARRNPRDRSVRIGIGEFCIHVHA